MADKSAGRDFCKTIEHKPIEIQPNNEISVLFMSISIIYVSAVPEL